ncbi:hypothetical protein EV356DRAFT_573557 [Viridothelium virens]|uniref:CCHC-type domain-containing protein n=1 Tax=Viridothelium virens TaxID=1048519 RepID=A0A6A6HII8_VIRVR|nr:hypothetical protein EV356DRAFT_573557 [Viridothelium virens]
MARVRNNRNQNHRNNQNHPNNQHGQNRQSNNNNRNENNNFSNNRRNSNYSNNNSGNNNQNDSRNGRNGRHDNGFQGTCNNCGRLGHRAVDCNSRGKSNNRHDVAGHRIISNGGAFKTNLRDLRDRAPRSSKYCFYYKKDGHVTERCKYPPKICLNCLKKGHLQEQCNDKNPNLPIETDARDFCVWCNSAWHSGNACLEKQIAAQQSGRRSSESSMSDAHSGHTHEVIQSQPSSSFSAAAAAPSHPSNPLSSITAQAWAPPVFGANKAQHELQRHTCESCASSTHRTTECAAIQPCTSCYSPFHSRAACLDVQAAQPVLKPAVTLWQQRPEHAADPRYCVYCNATGHTTEACGNELAQAAHLGSALRCGQCGKRGHTDESCLNPTAQWGGPPTLQNLREQDWSVAWINGWRPACSKCEFAMDVYDVWNGDADVAMGGCVSGRLFIPAHVCKESVVWWVKMEY